MACWRHHASRAGRGHLQRRDRRRHMGVLGRRRDPRGPAQTPGHRRHRRPRRRRLGDQRPQCDPHLLPDGEQREILSGEEVCGFNDLGAGADGALLAGVLRYRPLAGESPRPGQLLAVGGDGSVEVLTEDVIWPNGIGLSPDGHTIYLSDYAPGSGSRDTHPGRGRHASSAARRRGRRTAWRSMWREPSGSLSARAGG